MTETDTQALINKFRQILTARMRGNKEEARTLFDGINIEDFPVMPKFVMSHGCSGDAEGACSLSITIGMITGVPIPTGVICSSSTLSKC
jgi:hypothetical protein